MAVSQLPRQAHGPAVDQRHAPASAEHPEDGVSRRNAQIAPDRELQPASNSVAFDRRDHGLCEQHPRRTHRTVALPAHAVATSPGDSLQICSRAETALRAGQHGHAHVLVCLEGPERICEQGGGRSVDTVPHLWAIDGDDRHGSISFVRHVAHVSPCEKPRRSLCVRRLLLGNANIAPECQPGRSYAATRSAQRDSFVSASRHPWRPERASAS